jgi:large subunit ribosomal protein L10
MDQPRPEKVAVVDEVRERLSSSQAVLLTEYRGIDVAGMATLRRRLREAGGEYKVYKNTLVRRAVQELGLELDELLTGPTALAFVPQREGADPTSVAKVLKAFGKDNPDLVVKGGLLGDRVLSAADTRALAEVPSREELLARLAGGLAAPMQKLAGLLQALPRNFAYGLSALIQAGGAPGAPSAEAPAAESAPEAPADEAPAAEASAADEAVVDEGTADEAAVGEPTTDEPVAESTSSGDDAGTDPEPADAGDDTTSAETETTQPEQES